MKIRNKRISRKNLIEIIRSLREAGNVVEIKKVFSNCIDIIYFNPTSD